MFTLQRFSLFLLAFLVSPLTIPSSFAGKTPEAIGEIHPMLSSMFEAEENKHQLRGSLFGGEETVCHGELGCFSTSGPMAHLARLPQSPATIGTQFFAYRSENPSKGVLLDLHNLGGSPKGALNAEKKIAFVIHGFIGSHSDPLEQKLKNALLRGTNNEVGTVIMVNWKKGAFPSLSLKYVKAAANTQLVGRQVALLVEKLKIQWGIDPLRVHLLGFSLGAQVSGFAGKYSQATYGWKFGRISGLDAAWPLFEGHPGAYLTQADAHFVDAIHTSVGRVQRLNILAGSCGFTRPYGTVDFYPNAGEHQPMCKRNKVEKPKKPTTLWGRVKNWFSQLWIFRMISNKKSHFLCNHQSAINYFIASLNEKTSCQLKGFTQLTVNQTAKGDTVLGYAAANYRNISGRRYVFPREAYPYCAVQKKRSFFNWFY